MVTDEPVWWVLLMYRVPREPSSPRIAIWRRLRRLGVAQLGDGLVALPDDARTREQLEWVADEVVEAGGTAVLWRAHTLAATDERAVAQTMASARVAEYREVMSLAAAAGTAEWQRRRTWKRLRGELRSIRRRDFFPPPEAEQAAAAVAALGAVVEEGVFP